MRILVLGAGKMGSFFTDLLSFKHDVAVLDCERQRLRFVYNCRRFATYEEVKEFKPQLLINCVTLSQTVCAFNSVLPYLPCDCIISDIASVKTGLQDFYESSGFRYASVHPMFGPTFANLGNLQNENAIIINQPCSASSVMLCNEESGCKGVQHAECGSATGRGTDGEGTDFFRELFGLLKLNVREYTFKEHDEVVAYSLSIPFASTLVFGSVMKHQEVPGTTFKRHLSIARGLLGEDDYLLTEILFNPNTPARLEEITDKLQLLSDIVKRRDAKGMKSFLDRVRENLK